MFSLYRRELELDLRGKVNGLAYFFRKIPLLKKLLPGDTYRFMRLKQFLITLGPIARLLNLFFNSLVSLPILYFVVYGYSLVFRLQEDQIPVIMVCLYLVQSLTRFVLNDHQVIIRRFYELFHVSPHRTVRNKLFFDAPLQMVARAAAMAALGRLIGFDAVFAVLFSVSLYGLELLSNRIRLWLQSIRFFESAALVKTIGIPLVLFLALVVPALMFQWDVKLLVRFVLLPFSFLAGLVSAWSLWQYPNYTSDFETFILPAAAAGPDAMDMKAIMQESSKLKDGDLEKEISVRPDIQGYPLLNRLFFRRHRRLLRKPFLLKTAVITGLLALATVYLYFPVRGLPPLPAADVAARMPGILPFLAYICFNHEQIIQKMFINCDQAFLEYDFYRRPDDLLRMFSARLRTLLRWNLLPASLLVILLSLALTKIGVPGTDIVIMGIQLFALALFFSVHTLFVYYMFQPYNADLQVKNPVYLILQIGVYLLCFLTMQLGLRGFAVAPVFIGAAIVYSAIALWAIRRYAPSRFRVRS